MNNHFFNEDRLDGERFSPQAEETSALIPPTGDHVAAQFDPHRAVAGWRRAMLRRLAALLCTGAAAFTLTTWALVQRERRRPPEIAGLLESGAERGGTAEDKRSDQTGNPAATARAQLDSLNRGEVRSAYEMFSPAYRAKVPLEAFKALVTSYRTLFRTEEEEMESTTIGPDRTRIDVHLQSEDQERYIAHFILARIDGHWFVDDLRWVNADDEDEDLTSA